ncbi:hypothetical protein C5167_031145 [Papaver somniferum]|nr:hypothetical protein C5167_031145 [Papaver somniferum]
MVEHVRRLMCGTWSNFSDLRGVMITIPTHETVTFDNTNQGPGCPRISLRMGIQLDAVAHGALICGYFGMGKVSLALRFQTEIVKWNCSPNVITRAKMKTCRFILFCSGLLDIGFVSYGLMSLLSLTKQVLNIIRNHLNCRTFSGDVTPKKLSGVSNREHKNK